MTTLEKLVAGILADRGRETFAIGIHNAIARALLRFDGKKVNKRLEGYVLDELASLGGTTIQTEYTVGQTYLRVWGIGPFNAYNNCSRHFLGYAADMACYNQTMFARYDASNGEAAIRRNADRSALLESGTLIALAKAIDKHNETYKVIMSLTESGSFGHQAHYIARRMLEGTEDYKRAEQEAREARRR